MTIETFDELHSEVIRIDSQLTTGLDQVWKTASRNHEALKNEISLVPEEQPDLNQWRFEFV
jgi:hypothetical protein